ncbi:Aldehyde dehydrogenase family [Acididesulfobacillus acetoxydans]|uniref:Aldehyde dehydrogenase family n=1 Tax=Acididesulfobacillus acetoxydans TaxID=1561005 RepID=A0A8S0XWW4_9FIRM|nr:aldehyde dehydrogenase [Acididesulfobacillus acetoxydans]CAA7601317.1 Aldehyde dehydrogenase family [Acididesulfobacillus acetoxydans]CEJ08773.1 Lactaldehyde dehydrogenase [Acididesulfobacillus acetoxydans]
MKKYQLYIDGEFVSRPSGRVIAVTNPATEEVISEVPAGTVEDVAEAVVAAERAQRSWAKLPAVERAGYLHKIADGLRENAEDLARTIAEEQGKILPLSRVEVDFSADYLDYMAEFARRYEGEIIQSDRPNENILLYKMPIGVVAGILPWNFPFFLIVRKMAPALVTGNTIVLKPSSETPNNAFEFAKIVEKSSLPKGVFNLVSGSGGVVGAALAGHPKVGMVSLTGSVEAGIQAMKAAANNVTKVSLELGGKAPAIVMADADLDLAAQAIRDSRVINTGQVCNCAERVYVHESVAEKFIAKVTQAMQNTKYGDPLTEADLDMGPLVSKQQLENVDAAVRQAVKDGAQVVLGGKASERQKGYYYEPTVLTNCRQETAIMRQEIFGPVLPITTFKDLDEAIEMANDCEYGLTSSIYTQNIDVAMRACNEIKFGETYINRENFEAMQGFHAGWRKSGIGGADGKHGLEEYLQTHVVYLQYNRNVK